MGRTCLEEMHRHQSSEFAIRARALPALDVLRSATTVAARLCCLEGRAGVIEAWAWADPIVVDGDPLRDWSLLEGQGEHMPVITHDGRHVKRGLDGGSA